MTAKLNLNVHVACHRLQNMGNT